RHPGALGGRTGRGGNRDISGHRPLRRTESAPADGRKLRPASVGEPDAYVRSEQASEHVPVDERGDVAEHRLDLDPRVGRQQRPEAVLVLLGRLGDLHRASSNVVSGPALPASSGYESILLRAPAAGHPSGIPAPAGAAEPPGTATELG